MISNKIKSELKGIGKFLVGVSNIVSCAAAVFSCVAAYIAASEIINLRIEINPVVERFWKDPVINIGESDYDNEQQLNGATLHSTGLSSQHILLLPKSDIDAEATRYVSSKEVDSIRNNRDKFWQKMKNIFGNR